MKIYNQDRLTQVIDLTLNKNSKIYPTDIDAVLEFDNKYLLIFEVKAKGVEVPIGQKIVFERIADCWQEFNGESFIVYCEHETEPDEVIKLSQCNVFRVYHKGISYHRNETVYNFLERMSNKYDITKLKNAL